MVKLKLTFALLFVTILTAQDNCQLVGFEDFAIEHVYTKGDTLWINTVDSTWKSEVYYSFTAGDTWNKVSDTDSLINGWLKLVTVNPYNSLLIYAKTENGRGLKSTDGGKNWTFIFADEEPWNESAELMDIYVSPHNKNILFGVIQFYTAVLRRSLDGGISWEDVGNFPSSSHGSSLVFAYDPLDSMKMYVEVDDKNFYVWFFVSYNLGDQWTFLSYLEGDPRQVLPMSTNPDTIYVFPGRQRSNNNGNEWELILKEIMVPGLPFQPSVRSACLDLKKPMDVYVSLVKWDSTFSFRETLGLFKRDVGDDNWILLPGSELLPLQTSYNPNTLFIDSTNHKLYVGTKKGLYSYDLITSIKENDINPTKFKLYQNYPNPFNPTTQINYHLTQNSFVTLKIYDVAGRILKTLVNQQQNIGEHSVTFDGYGFPSGIYFYRLTTSSGFIQGRKMLLVK